MLAGLASHDAAANCLEHPITHVPMLLVQLAACILLVLSKRLSRKLNSKQNQRQAFRFRGQLYQRQRHSQPLGFCHSHIQFWLAKFRLLLSFFFSFSWLSGM